MAAEERLRRSFLVVEGSRRYFAEVAVAAVVLGCNSGLVAADCRTGESCCIRIVENCLGRSRCNLGLEVAEARDSRSRMRRVVVAGILGSVAAGHSCLVVAGSTAAVLRVEAAWVCFGMLVSSCFVAMVVGRIGFD